MRYRLALVTLELAVFAIPLCCAAQEISRKDVIGRSRTSVDPAVEAAAKAAAAKPTPKSQDGRPDLSGYWKIPGSLSNPFGGGTPGPQAAIVDGGKTRVAVFGALPGEAVPSSSTSISNPAPYTAEAAAKRAELAKDPAHNDPSRYNCHRGGIPRIGPPNQIVQTPNAVVLLYEQTFANNPGSTFRLVTTTNRRHNENADVSDMGDSVGHWEGDTLVIDVIDLDPSTWLRDGVYPHSDALHVIERLTRKGDTLQYTVVVDDPKMMTKPWTMNSLTLILGGPHDQIPPDVPCTEDDIQHIDHCANNACDGNPRYK